MKKRIAFVTNKMVVGGVEKVLTELLNRIDYCTYEVDLWLRQPGGDFFSLINSNVNIKYWGTADTKAQLVAQLSQRQIIAFLKGLIYRFSLRMTGRNWALNEIFAAKAQSMCSDKQYDCVIAYQGISPSVIATVLYRLNAKKKIAWIHGKDAFLPSQVSRLKKEYMQFDHLFCVSESTKNNFCIKYEGLEHKTTVIYNPVNTQEILQNADQAVSAILKSISIVTVGRLSELKGQTLVPKAAKLLLDEGYPIHWYLVGDGEQRTAIESLIAANGVQNYVFLLGAKMNPYPYIKHCDIYVQPSFSEGYCTTTVEAKILCKPIVTTDAPGMREQFVSGENGLIVDAMTPEALAEGIKTLLDHPEMREKFRNALKMESYDVTKELQKLYDFIES